MDAIDVRVPGDKSITHRALILGSLADGASRIRRPLDSADTRSTAAVLRALGVEIGGFGGEELVVRGRGLRAWRAPAAALDCGNSGTTARLMLGALAGCPWESRVTGDASLQSRPMRRVTDPLTAAGAAFEELGERDRLPIRVRGRRPLDPVSHDGPRASAQVKSALLLAGLTGGAPARVSEPGLSRDHTERMLRSMAATVVVTEREGRSETALAATSHLEPLDATVPGDPSSAMFFLGLGALLGRVRTVGISLNPPRTGALGVLMRMGADVRIEGAGDAGGEPLGSVTVAASSLQGTLVEGREVPSLLDEIPLLAAVAAAAEGETRFEGVAELRVKESDRLAALATNLRGLGVEVEEEPDVLVVRGARGPLRGTVHSFEDHRIAMAFGVLAALPGNDISIEGRDAVSISFPTFWTELERVRTELERT